MFLEILPILDEKTKLNPNFSFWMESQIKPNFPIFLETLPILDEKPNYAQLSFISGNTSHFG
jgi:hypothetical protein